MSGAITQKMKEKTGALDKAAVIQNSLAAAKSQIAANAALGIDPDRLIAIVGSAIIRNPALLACTPQSLVEATIKAARYGLDPSGITGDGFLVPFKDRAEFICGYRGLVKLAMRHPRVKLVEARLVYENDKFEIDYGRENPIQHKIALKDRGEIIGCYARAFLDGAPPAIEWMDVGEINAIRNQSRSYQRCPAESPWTKFWGEMARKTVLRRLIKYLPLEFEISLALADLDAVEFPQFTAGFLANGAAEGNGKDRDKGGGEPVDAQGDEETPFRAYVAKIQASDMQAITEVAEAIKHDDTLSDFEKDELLRMARRRYNELKKQNGASHG